MPGSFSSGGGRGGKPVTLVSLGSMLTVFGVIATLMNAIIFLQHAADEDQRPISLVISGWFVFGALLLIGGVACLAVAAARSLRRRWGARAPKRELPTAIIADRRK